MICSNNKISIKRMQLFVSDNAGGVDAAEVIRLFHFFAADTHHPKPFWQLRI